MQYFADYRMGILLQSQHKRLEMLQQLMEPSAGRQAGRSLGRGRLEVASRTATTRTDDQTRRGGQGQQPGHRSSRANGNQSAQSGPES